MSIYSGFGTRNQEATHNKILYNICYLLQLKISKHIKNGKSCSLSKQSLEYFDDSTF